MDNAGQGEPRGAGEEVALRRECLALRAELADTKALLARGVEFVEEDAQLRALLKGLAARMRECRPLRSQDSGYVIPQELVEGWADEIEKLAAEPGT